MNNKIKLIFVITVISLGFLFYFVSNYNYINLGFVKNEIQETKIFENNLNKLIKINSIDDIEKKKYELTDFIWKSGYRSDKIPDLIIEDFNDLRYNNLENLEKIQKFEVNMINGVNSIVYHFIPKNPNNKLIIYIQGHDGDFFNGIETIETLINKGYSVAAFSMPLTGMNNQPVVETDFGKMQILSHKYFELLDDSKFSSMLYFFEPINVVINYLEKEFHYTQFHAIGISGGGWTVTVYSTLDERISKIFSVAGSVPFYMRSSDKNIGDYEQINSEFYRIANYLELYTIASIGPSKNLIQIFNKYDPCCFSGENFNYEDLIKEKISQINSGGNFKIYLDENTRKHEISKWSMNKILEELDD